MAEGNSDLPDFTPDKASNHKPYQHRPRRGRLQHNNEGNLSSHGLSQKYGHFHQSFTATSNYCSSNNAMHPHPPYQNEDGARGRGRGRGRREGNRNENFGGFSSWRQRPGNDFAPYGGYRGAEAFNSAAHPIVGPDGPRWQRETMDRNLEQTNEDQDAQAKKHRRISQEQKRGQQNEKSTHLKDNKPLRNQRSNSTQAEVPPSDTREGLQKSSERTDLQHNSHQKTRSDSKRRHGPIKPPPQDEANTLRQDNVRSESVHGRTFQDPDRKDGQDSGRDRSLQDRGGRRNLQQKLRPNKKNWAKMPESKETQTGRLIEQLSEEKYECMVCCDVIRLMAPVWSCQSCFHVFHLNCIKKWARSPTSQADESAEGWRCPACQSVTLKVPTSYTCFCDKVTNPEWQRSEIPHSCGNMCGKKRSSVDCNHPCNILCHPGPCPQCPAFVTKSCICGKTSQPVRCGQNTVLQCGNVCAALLNCGEHTCAQVCHSGACPPCQLQVQQACFCGSATRDVLCGTDKERFDGSGHFSCQKVCERMLDCGAHRCEQLCHSFQCQLCPRSPSLVKTCSCGQTLLNKLMELGYPERQRCSDPIPSCGKTCNRPMACGSSDVIHLCQTLCHEGSCGPCSLTSTVRCRCGSKTKEVPCAAIQKEEELVFTCEKRCNKKRSCGRHKCIELCCISEEHKCFLVCGYKLNCGTHRCQEPCHRGNCEPCWQTSFDELTCHCGLTVLYPPIACGTKPPECKNMCNRRHECEHPVFHNCHSEEKCPPCTYLTQKWCMGKHEQRSNIPCHLQDISCGLTCNKTLPCETHRCRRICHRDECLKEARCQQPCTLPRPDCGHPCSAPCHKGSDCPRTTCTAKVDMQCECGRRKETVNCTDASSSYQRYAAIAMATKLSDMQLGDSMDMAPFLSKKEMKPTRLECDQECATLERNRRLAEALQINLSSDTFHIRSTSIYSDSLKEDARKDLKFVTEVEEEIKNLVELANKGKQPKRTHCFPPMNREHRKIIHDLAEVYGVESVSYDSEPKRNVVITAQKGKAVCPNSTLTSLIERETAARAPPPIAHIKQHSSKAASGGSWSKMVKEEPVIDYFDVQD